MAVSEEECSSAKCGTSSSSSSTAHYLAKCVLRASVVLQVLYGHIRSPSYKDVVLGKETSIELVIIGEDGIVQSVCDQPVFGTIKDLALLPWNGNFGARDLKMWGKDLLVVISDSGKLTLLTFCNEMHRFFPITHVQLSDVGNTRNLPGRMLTVHPSGCFFAVSAYEDQVALFSMSQFPSSEIIDERITYPSESEGNTSNIRTGIQGTIWSMCFISRDSGKLTKDHTPVLAVLLNRKGELLNKVVLLQWDIKARAVDVVLEFVEDGPLAHDIVGVPNCPGLAFLFRAGDALLMNLSDARYPCLVCRTSLNFSPNAVEELTFVEDPYKLQDVDDESFNAAAYALLQLSRYDPMCIDNENSGPNSGCKYVCSWCWEPENRVVSRMIFCLDSGEFFMIEIHIDSKGPLVSVSECLYKGLACKALLWVEDGYLAAFVEMGDGMVLRWEDGRLCYTSSIKNIAPILDMAVVDLHGEKHNQIFACCGVAPEGSLRIIQSGISVEQLLRTAPIYQGVTGTWTVQMKAIDSYHSFLVLSFVEETRLLSVGLSFTDVTDSVGFEPKVCTLACGLVSDGLLGQIHQCAVRLCLPTKAAHSEGIPLPSPICTSWSPGNVNINLGAIGHNFIVVSTSNPSFLLILGVRLRSTYHYEIFEMQQLELQNEISCISIPKKEFKHKQSDLSISASCKFAASLPNGLDINKSFVIGTHKPSVEILSFTHARGVKYIACGTISFMSTLGTAMSGCVPQDVRLVCVDRFYVLAGLRNGMLLRFEWPSDQPTSPPVNEDTTLSNVNFINSEENDSCKADNLPAPLQLIATRHIGITPVFLVPLGDELDADIIALSDRRWLLHSAKHSLSYTSIAFEPSTHVTPVFSVECPKGILFVAENSLHLVEMVENLNVQKFHLEGTPRKVLYHSESRMLIVLRTELNCDTCSSDVCCVDPTSGSVLSSFKLEIGEIGKSMEFVRVGSDWVLVVGTSLSSGPAIMPSGEAESTSGRLLVLCLEHGKNSDSGSMMLCSKSGSSSQRTSPFQEIAGYVPEQLSTSSLGSSSDDYSSNGNKLDEDDVWRLQLAYATKWQGMVLAICPYLDRYFLASAGNAFYVCGFPNDNPRRVRKFAAGRTRYMITSLTAHVARIAVGDCRDGILFYSYHEEARKLEQLYFDPYQRLVADCILMDAETAVVSDRKGNFSVLCSEHLEDNVSPECNLKLSCAYYMAEVAMSMQKGSFAYRLPFDDVLQSGDGPKTRVDSFQNAIIASTLLGSMMIFIRLSREEYELLEAVQARLVVHPLTAPILGNNHNEFRSRENPVGTPKILDGDMLTQFLELTSIQQHAILSSEPHDVIKSSLKPPSPSYVQLNQVVQLLERVHYALS